MKMTRRIRTIMAVTATTVALFVLTTGTASTLNAQENFSGTWVFNETKSDGGQGQQGQMRMIMAAAEMKVTQSGDNMEIEKTMRGGRGGETRTTTEKYDLTGKVTNNPMMNNARRSTVRWSNDKKVMTIASTISIEMQGNYFDLNQTEEWRLTDGGRTLTIKSTISTQMGDMTTTMVYDKK